MSSRLNDIKDLAPLVQVAREQAILGEYTKAVVNFKKALTSIEDHSKSRAMKD